MVTQIKFENGVIGYPKFEINNVSFTANEGDIIGLIGKSGSGKSTLIKTILNEIKLRGGTAQKPPLRKIGYSSQDNALFPFLTIEENIVAFGRLQKMKRKDIYAIMLDLLTRFQLMSARNRQVRHLSGGMKKRVDVVIAMLHNPDVLILDEPFNGLDIAMQSFLWEKIIEIARSNTTVLISSHFIEDLERHANQIHLIHNNYFYNHDTIKQKRKNISLKEYATRLFHS